MSHNEPKESMCIPHNRQNCWHGYNATQDPRKIMQLCNAEVNQCDFVQTRQTAYRWKALTSKKTISHRFVDFSKNLEFAEPQRTQFRTGGSSRERQFPKPHTYYPAPSGTLPRWLGVEYNNSNQPSKFCTGGAGLVGLDLFVCLLRQTVRICLEVSIWRGALTYSHR